MRLSAGGARNTASNCCASAGLIKSSLGSGGRGGGGLEGPASAMWGKLKVKTSMSKSLLGILILCKTILHWFIVA